MLSAGGFRTKMTLNITKSSLLSGDAAAFSLSSDACSTSANSDTRVTDAFSAADAESSCPLRLDLLFLPHDPSAFTNTGHPTNARSLIPTSNLRFRNDSAGLSSFSHTHVSSPNSDSQFSGESESPLPASDATPEALPVPAAPPAVETPPPPPADVPSSGSEFTLRRCCCREAVDPNFPPLEERRPSLSLYCPLRLPSAVVARAEMFLLAWRPRSSSSELEASLSEPLEMDSSLSPSLLLLEFRRDAGVDGDVEEEEVSLPFAFDL
ncbi:hypothetical protein KEM55_005070 [Ascosphaera atra]|nr:hypothetical protein KEM55_005070 [Ascosphaera atra]